MKRMLITVLTVAIFLAMAIPAYATPAETTDAVASDDNARAYVNSKIITECSFYRDKLALIIYFITLILSSFIFGNFI